MYSGSERRKISCEYIGECGVGEIRGELGIIKELLSAHIKQTREERYIIREELNEIKTEIIKYKFLFRGLMAVGSAITAGVVMFYKEIASLWS